MKVDSLAILAAFILSLISISISLKVKQSQNGISPVRKILSFLSLALIIVAISSGLVSAYR